MIDSLSALPCFTQVEKILIIASGLSQSCFKVYADNKVYFAKTITDNTEVSVTECAAKYGLSPTVIYHDKNWLICNFIDAYNLAQSALVTKEKIQYAMMLMVQCHQLNSKPAELAVKEIINSLVNKSHYSILQQTALLQFAELILPLLNNSKNNVCCHGDLNFSNVLMNQAKNVWLVDYECACTAPIEYDLAMFIAVNNLDSDEITIIIEQYEMQSSVNVDPLLLNHYLLFCYFINGLWYFNTYHQKVLVEEMTEDKAVLLKHAQKQWYGLHSSLKVNNSPLLSRLSSKLTNIFTTLNFSNQT